MLADEKDFDYSLPISAGFHYESNASSQGMLRFHNRAETAVIAITLNTAT